MLPHIEQSIVARDGHQKRCKPAFDWRPRTKEMLVVSVKCSALYRPEHRRSRWASTEVQTKSSQTSHQLGTQNKRTSGLRCALGEQGRKGRQNQRIDLASFNRDILMKEKHMYRPVSTGASLLAMGTCTALHRPEHRCSRWASTKVQTSLRLKTQNKRSAGLWYAVSTGPSSLAMGIDRGANQSLIGDPEQKNCWSSVCPRQARQKKQVKSS